MRIQAVLGLSVLLFSAHLEATSLSLLISSADAIVVGTESSPLETASGVGFYIDVERVFTGAIPVGARVNVTWKGSLRGASAGYRGIWFLKKSADNAWDCLPAGTLGHVTFHPDLSLPVSQGPLPGALAYDASSTPLADQLSLEAAAGMPRSDAGILLSVANQPYSQAALRAFRYLASSGRQDQMLAGVTALSEAGDPDALLSAEKISGTLTTAVPGADTLAGTIKVRFRNPDPVAVAALGRMATSTEASPLLQDASAQALAAIHSQTALPWLGLLVMGSSPQLQIQGALGLSYFVNGLGIPTAETLRTLDHLNNLHPSVYRTEETDKHIGFVPGQQAPFIQYWRGWWQAHPELQVAQGAQ